MSTPAQITICGSLETATIAALVDLAMRAGAALLVQPRAVEAPVVDVPAPRALPPAKRRTSRRAPRAPSQKAVTSSDRLDGAPSDADVRAFLRKEGGPVALVLFREHFALTDYIGRQVLTDLATRGVVQLTGVTNGRRVGLPGQPAKEAP